MTSYKTCCTRHCMNGCAMIVDVAEDGSTSIKGDKDQDFTRGLICKKTRQYMDVINDPTRITAPRVRQQDGSMKDVSWDEALSAVCDKIKMLSDTPERILHLRGHASYGIAYKASSHLFGMIGASTVGGNECDGGGQAALQLDFGAEKEPSPHDLEYSNRIVNWGRSFHAGAYHLGRIVNDARKKGAKCLSIHVGDKGYTDFSDDIITIRPGTDRFLAAAVIIALMHNGFIKPSLIGGSSNFAEFRSAIESVSFDECVDTCGLTRSDVELVGEYYMEAGPTATIMGRGLQRYLYGGENVRFINALAYLTGNIGVRGGGSYYQQDDQGKLVKPWPKHEAPRELPIHRLGQSIMEADPALEMVWIEGINAVGSLPDSLSTRQALEETFTVVVGAFPNDTALCADVILPPALMFECEDICAHSTHAYTQYAAKIFEPRGQARSNFDIAADIASRLSLPFPSLESILRESLNAPNISTTLETLREDGYTAAKRAEVPFENGEFAHEDGLYRFPETLSREPDTDKLKLLTLIQRDTLLSSVPSDQQQGPATILVSPLLLHKLGIQDGDKAVLSTANHKANVIVRKEESLHEDAVLYPRGDWLCHGRGINRMIEPLEADLAGQCAYYSQTVRIEKTEQ